MFLSFTLSTLSTIWMAIFGVPGEAAVLTREHPLAVRSHLGEGLASSVPPGGQRVDPLAVHRNAPSRKYLSRRGRRSPRLAAAGTAAAPSGNDISSRVLMLRLFSVWSGQLGDHLGRGLAPTPKRAGQSYTAASPGHPDDHSTVPQSRESQSSWHDMMCGSHTGPT